MHPAVEIIGSVAAFVTTLGWVPQLLKVARARRAGDISLAATGSIAVGVFLWTVYGILIDSWPVIAANAATFLFVSGIIMLKLRYG